MSKAWEQNEVPNQNFAKLEGPIKTGILQRKKIKHLLHHFSCSRLEKHFKHFTNF